MKAPEGAAELLAAVDAVATALTRQGIVYFITGSFASSLQGEYRATNDVDLVVEIDAPKLDALLERAGEDAQDRLRPKPNVRLAPLLH